MIMIRYADEGPVTYRCEADRQELEAIKYQLGVTVREVCAMAHIIYKASLDPICAIGPEFVWSYPNEYGLGEVPAPYANVDVEEAFDHAVRDGKACERLLQNDNSLKA